MVVRFWVQVIKKKPEYILNHSQKQYVSQPCLETCNSQKSRNSYVCFLCADNRSGRRHLRFIIFTMEVAVAAMPPGVDQWVLILDAGGNIISSCYLPQCVPSADL